MASFTRRTTSANWHLFGFTVGNARINVYIQLEKCMNYTRMAIRLEEKLEVV